MASDRGETILAEDGSSDCVSPASRSSPATVVAERTYSVSEAARFLAISSTQLRRHDDVLRPVRIQGERVYTLDRLRAFAAQRPPAHRREPLTADGAVASDVFAAFGEGATMVDIVITRGLLPELVQHLRDQWMRMRQQDEGAMYIAAEYAEQLPVRTARGLVEHIRDLDDRCTRAEAGLERARSEGRAGPGPKPARRCAECLGSYPHAAMRTLCPHCLTTVSVEHDDGGRARMIFAPNETGQSPATDWVERRGM